MSRDRVKGVCFSIPIVYGSQAIPLTQKEKEKGDIPANHSHKWSVFVRGVNGEDLSFVFRRVTFRLHSTYAANNRIVEESPFEVSETGWGEFEIVIKILFTHKCNEKQLTLFHGLRLFPSDDVTHTCWTKGKTVYSFHYDEIVFNEPYDAFYQVYLKQPRITLPEKKSTIQPYSIQAEQEEYEKLNKVKDKLKTKLHQMQLRLRNLKLNNHLNRRG